MSNPHPKPKRCLPFDAFRSKAESVGFWTHRQIADAVGSTVTAIHARTQRNTITFWDADRFCGRMGWHPIDVWPDWYEITALSERSHHKVEA